MCQEEVCAVKLELKLWPLGTLHRRHSCGKSEDGGIPSTVPNYIPVELTSYPEFGNTRALTGHVPVVDYCDSQCHGDIPLHEETQEQISSSGSASAAYCSCSSMDKLSGKKAFPSD